MYRLKNNYIPKIFTDLIKKHPTKYPTKFSKSSYTSKSLSVSNMRYCISIRDQSYGMNFCNAKRRKSNPTHFFNKP